MATRYAYTALLMKGVSYLPGVKALSASLKASGTQYDFVLMVTPDVDVTLVQPYATHVVQVPYLTCESLAVKTAKQREMYTNWKDDSYSKWNALSLVSYEKVLLLDLDIVVLENLDSLFELQAPAATFSNAWAAPYVKGKGGLYNPYVKLQHGDAVPPEAIHQGLESSFVLIGTTVLLQPSAEAYQDFQRFMKQHQPYGHKGCYSMMDEQSLSQFYLERGVTFTHISQRYNAIPWHVKLWLPRGEEAAVFHYFGDKPWNMKRGEWPDLDVWWKFYDAASSTSDAYRY